MNYDVACVQDCGDSYRVKYVDNYQNSLLKNDAFFVKISNVAADVIREHIRNGNMVFLPKGVTSELCYADIVVVESDDLDRKKITALTKARNHMDYKLFNQSAMDFFDYMNTFNHLASLGYFIANNNREEKYIEIIESGDEELIRDLEIYLENKDKLENMSYLFNKIRRFDKDVIDCTSQEELEQLECEFYSD